MPRKQRFKPSRKPKFVSNDQPTTQKPEQSSFRSSHEQPSSSFDTTDIDVVGK
jgi:hypothetical protein